MYGCVGYRIIFRRPVTVRGIFTTLRLLAQMLCVIEVDSVLDGRHAVEEAMSEF